MNDDIELAITFKTKTIRLTRTNNPNEFLSLRTIALRFGKGGNDFVRDVLGVKNYGANKRTKLPSRVEAAALNMMQNSLTEEETLGMQNLSETLDKVDESFETLETAFQDDVIIVRPEDKADALLQERQDVGVETDQRLMQNMRDLERAYQFIGTMSDQVKISAAKISAFDQ